MLTAIKDYFKAGFKWADKISIGKIDNNADNGKKNHSVIIDFGRLDNAHNRI